jgi:hypothetical protein
MRGTFRVAGLAVLMALSVNCGGGTEPDDGHAGTLVIELTTPNADDAAIKLTINSPVAPTAISAAEDGLEVFRTGDLGTSTTVIVTGAMAAGPLLKIRVPDTREDEQYSATVVQVASTTYALRSNAGYALAVTK